METHHPPGTDGVVRFPVERRAKPTLMLAEELTPRSDLADAMADELAETQGVCRWTGGEGRPDTLAQAVEAFTPWPRRWSSAWERMRRWRTCGR